MKETIALPLSMTFRGGSIGHLSLDLGIFY